MTQHIETSKPAGKRPASEIRLGRIKAAIWENAAKTPEGRTTSSVTVNKLYRTNTGGWQTTTSFDRDDLPVLMKVLDKVYEQLLQPVAKKEVSDEQQ